MRKIDDIFYRRMATGARNYALADKSDPFALARAMSHIANGIAGIDAQGRDAFYSADQYQEERVTITGVHYMATVYKNMVRP